MKIIVIDKFNTSLYIDPKLQMTEGLSISRSRLALNKFLFYYLKDRKIPLINSLIIFYLFVVCFSGCKLRYINLMVVEFRKNKVWE